MERPSSSLDLERNEGPRVSGLGCAAALKDSKLEADIGFMGFGFVVRHL